jgi:hypothetical protein
VFVAKNGEFLKKEFIEKGLGERTVQLEEVRELEQTEQSSAAPETVPRHQAMPETSTPPTAPNAPALTSGVNASAEAITEPRRSSRLRAPPKRYGDEVKLLDNDEPATYKEAMMGPDSIKWLQAMKSEIESMYENQVWSLADPPEVSRPIEYKWIFKKKTDANGNVSVYKARLVTKGFRQI